MPPSNDPWIISGMRDRNAPLEMPVAETLCQIIDSRPVHARFMNTLSMLEHIGSRKIMLSQMNRPLSEDTLKHLAEEARHAYFFKRQAERAFGGAMDGYTADNTLARGSAMMYFERLDAGISRQVGQEQAYPWVSLIVELRACWLYRIYQDALIQKAYALSLKSLLAEEDLHLAEMFALCGEDEKRLCTLSAFESDLFEKLWGRIKKAALALGLTGDSRAAA